MTNFWIWLAWKLPRELTYWCAVRVMAHASERFPSKEVDSLTPADCLKSWNEQ
jgi:hypothetical protein